MNIEDTETLFTKEGLKKALNTKYFMLNKDGEPYPLKHRVYFHFNFEGRGNVQFKILKDKIIIENPQIYCISVKEEIYDCYDQQRDYSSYVTDKVTFDYSSFLKLQNIEQYEFNNVHEGNRKV